MTTQRQNEITALIERSSLGAPGARKLRARTTPQRRSQIIEKAATRSAVSRQRTMRGIAGGR